MSGNEGNDNWVVLPKLDAYQYIGITKWIVNTYFQSGNEGNDNSGKRAKYITVDHMICSQDFSHGL